MFKFKSRKNSLPANMSPLPGESLQDFLTRTALEFRESQMQLHPHHLPIENNDTIHELLE